MHAVKLENCQKNNDLKVELLHVPIGKKFLLTICLLIKLICNMDALDGIRKKQLSYFIFFLCRAK